MELLTRLHNKSLSLPRSPGCYLMKNGHGQIIYIGKAKDLKSRVSSYFNQSPLSIKTQILVGHIVDFDFLIAENEIEALILESNLIKKHRPKYNIRLKDDKSYPYVEVDFTHDFPSPRYIHRPKIREGCKIYGPFVHGSNISQVLSILIKAFQLRDCSLTEFRKRKEPCLLYQMEQCTAPCVKLVSKEAYALQLKWALNILSGGEQAKESLDFLQKRMEQNATEEKFEAAAMVRDQISTLQTFLQNQLRPTLSLDKRFLNLDLWSYFSGDEEIDLGLYVIRQGQFVESKNFHFYKDDGLWGQTEQHSIDEQIKQEFFRFVNLYYFSHWEERSLSVPQNIILPCQGEELNQLALSMQKLTGLGSIEVFGPDKKFESLLNTVYSYAKEQQKVRHLQLANETTALNQLAELLQLKQRPRLIECFDVAIWQGKSPTASQVVFYDGLPDKKAYRYYHLQERPEGNNDFAMMKEVFLRRADNGDLPDLFVVDGGKGQLNIALQALKECHLQIPVVALAKAKNLKSKQTEERVFIAGRANPYILKSNSALYRLMVQMRDEAHRFSRKLHHKTELKRVLKGG